MSSTTDALHRELERQRDVLLGEMPERILLTTLAFGLCLPFVSPFAMAIIASVYLVAEAVGLYVLRPSFMLRSSFAYAVTMMQSVLIEATYMIAPSLVWQAEGEMAKAFAVGMAAMTLMHLATVRAIHLPCGVAGLGGAIATVLVFNSVYWLRLGDYIGLAISATAVFGALGYTLTAMLSINRLHRSMAAEEASARRAHESKSLFLAQISHELRTPLNAVIGMGQAELSEKGRDGPDEASYKRLSLLVENARTLSVILDDVTDLNASDHGRLRLRDRSVRLREEVAAFFCAFRDRAGRHGAFVELDLDAADPGLVLLDVVRLRQCIGNILNNALRHAPGGPIRAVARFLPRSDRTGRGHLNLTVSDSGPGIPAEKRELIFAPFHQGRSGAPGTGLGLAIARTLARQMGGDLVILPSDRGAVFQLSIEYALSTGKEMLTSVSPDLRSCRFLVVDDIASNRLVAATYLRGWGAQVIEAATGEDALKLLSSEDIDLVLLDMNMPGMDGFEVIRRLRLMGGRLASTTVVAMTADVMAEQLLAFRRAGIDGHVAKPLLPEELAKAILPYVG